MDCTGDSSNALSHSHWDKRKKTHQEKRTRVRKLTMHWQQGERRQRREAYMFTFGCSFFMCVCVSVSLCVCVMSCPYFLKGKSKVLRWLRKKGDLFSQSSCVFMVHTNSHLQSSLIYCLYLHNRTTYYLIYKCIDTLLLLTMTQWSEKNFSVKTCMFIIAAVCLVSFHCCNSN